MLEKIRDMLGLTNIPLEKLRTERKRINWDHIFLLEAVLWSERSHDPQTQCGCILARDNTILSSGYNGFISGIDDTQLPNMRPYKYPFMMHAELNALLNCAQNGVGTWGSTAYITSQPCNQCLQYLWQAGVCEIVFSDINVASMVQTEESENVRKTLLHLMDDKISIRFIPSVVLDISPVMSMYAQSVNWIFPKNK